MVGDPVLRDGAEGQIKDELAQQVVQSVSSAVALAEPFGLAFPTVCIVIWSHRLHCWVWFAAKKTGNVPQGVIEVTPEDTQRMQNLIDDGWDTATAIFRTLGVRPVDV